MKFRLVYDGPLPSANSGSSLAVKHKIRKQVHAQLKELFKTHPAFEDGWKIIATSPAVLGSVKLPVGTFEFVPLIVGIRHMTCDLDILFLRRAKAGSIIIPGGDIDNRIKNFFDALRIPDKPDELPRDASPDEGEKPFHCLLEDDALISGFSIRTDRLLSPLKQGEGDNDIRLVVDVSLHVSKVTWSTIGLVGD